MANNAQNLPMFATRLTPRERNASGSSGQASTGTGSESDAMHQAMLDVVSIWLSRLQTISAITSFFASIDSLLFSITSAPTTRTIEQLTSACITSALILHVFSSIIAFIGSFILVRFQLFDADAHEASILNTPSNASGANTPATRSRAPSADKPRSEKFRAPQPTVNAAFLSPGPVNISPADAEPVHCPGCVPHTCPHPGARLPATSPLGLITVHRVRPLREFIPFTKSYRNVALAATPYVPADSSSAGHGRSQREYIPPMLDPVVLSRLLAPPITLLQRAHAIAVALSAAGFVFSVVGVVAYTWAALPRAVSIVGTVCLGVGVAGLVGVLV
ncbi:hypothetical protein OBBRIDRAFT_793150 [Obba rivulosa]|uniref:Transmembrane protein n=1 Tax=Obba rivulosa TaxID=1052685 RepID=A0A8E2DKL9_9APHY|nr:hypothetical protein OBBRIDRAFT_793150 [Obba rivulosa]